MDTPIHFGIAVDGDAKRFCDEGLGGVYIANEIARLADPLAAVAIFDAGIWNAEAAHVTRPPNPLVPKVGGTMHQASSLEGVAALAGLPAEALRGTVEDYNRAVDAQAFSSLEPSRTPAVYRPRPIRTAPFYAAPLCAGITYTMGGIFIDGQCRVVRRAGGVFEGLYAAGSCTGGHEGGPVAGYTGGLGKAMTFGWHAGNCIGERARVLRPGALAA